MKGYTLTRLMLHQPTGNIHVEVRYKGHPIMKILEPTNPNHLDERNDYLSGDKGRINNQVEKLGNELVEVLMKEGILNTDKQPVSAEWFDLIPV